MMAVPHAGWMTARALIAYARSKGWRFKRRGKGSHFTLEHPRRPYDVVIADHGPKDIPRGLKETIVKQIEGTWSKR
jgi:predicted RNA binding protein YcfA (HicA-like mRNA interferase family)